MGSFVDRPRAKAFSPSARGGVNLLTRKARTRLHARCSEEEWLEKAGTDEPMRDSGPIGVDGDICHAGFEIARKWANEDWMVTTLSFASDGKRL